MSSIDTQYLENDDIRAHLRLLGAFHNLRQEAGEDQWPSRVAESVAKFRAWAQSLKASKKTLINLPNDLIPDLDILMVWHTYLLNPIKYQLDCENVYPGLSAFNFPLVPAANRLSSRPTISVGDPFASDHPLIWEEPSSVRLKDLAGAVHRQSSFITKVFHLGWTQHPLNRFLTKCVTRYTQFLDLMANGGVGSLVPTLDIDLAWHTHQLKGRVYRDQTRSLFGHPLNHDDTIAETQLKMSYDATANAWAARFGSPYLAPSNKPFEVKCGGGACSGECGSQDSGSSIDHDSVVAIAACGSGGCNGECGTCEPEPPIVVVDPKQGSHDDDEDCPFTPKQKENICGDGPCTGECGLKPAALMAW